MKLNHNALSLVLSVSLTMGGLLFLVSGATAQCVEMTDETADCDVSSSAQAIHSKKIEYALSVISNDQFLKNEPRCVAKALSFLGQFHVQDAVPQMVRLLTFEYKVSNSLSARTRNQQYPAISGLAGMGKTVIPTLLSAIDDSKGDPVVVENVMYAVMNIYESHPENGITVLQRKSESEQDLTIAARLHSAVEKAQSIWCKDSERCSVQTQ